MKLLIDLDGVVADFDRPFCALLEKLNNKPCPYEDPDVWEWPARRGFTEEEENKAWKYIQDHPEWWMTLPQYPDAKVKWRELRQGGTDVYFVTARRTKYSKLVSEDWLRYEADCPVPTVITTKDKGLICKSLHMDAAIDDRPENLVDIKVHSSFTRCYLRDRKHNQAAQPYLEKLGVVVIDSLQSMIDRELARLR